LVLFTISSGPFSDFREPSRPFFSGHSPIVTAFPSSNTQTPFGCEPLFPPKLSRWASPIYPQNSSLFPLPPGKVFFLVCPPWLCLLEVFGRSKLFVIAHCQLAPSSSIPFIDQFTLEMPFPRPPSSDVSFFRLGFFTASVHNSLFSCNF